MSLLILAGVGIELPYTSQNCNKVCWTRDHNTNEKLWVAVEQQASEVNYATTFLEPELADFNTITGTSNMAEHQIKLKDGKPIKQRYYPKNPKIQGEIKAMVDELLKMGFIEYSKSPYISPIVMVKKKTGKWRLCVVFRQINANSVWDAYPMPRIIYILDQLRESR